MHEEHEQPQKQKPSPTLQYFQSTHEAFLNLLEENTNLRMKYPNEPMKYYKSEEQIYNILEELVEEDLTKYLKLIIQSKIMVNIQKIMNHPNYDLYSKCIEIIYEIINEEPDQDEEYTNVYALLYEMIENNLYGDLVEILQKVEEENIIEHYELVYKILKIMQSAMQYHQASISLIIQQQKLIQYLANRILPNYTVKFKIIDDNKFVSSDLLVVILSKIKAQEVFLSMSGVEILLECIKNYDQIQKYPTNKDQIQYLINLFDCLNLILLSPILKRQHQLNSNNKLKDSAKQLNLMDKCVYHQMNGNKLMINFIKAKNQYSINALKIIANSLNVNIHESETEVVEKMIDFGILKYIFAIVMRQGIKGSDVDEQKVIDENTLNIVYALIKHSSQLYKVRVESKLTQKRYEKLQQLFEIRAEYTHDLSIGNTTSQVKQQQDKMVLTEQEYLNKIQEGFNVIEIIDKIFCCLAVSSSMISNRLVQLLSIFSIKATQLECNVRNAYQFIAEGSEKEVIERLLAKNIHVLKEKQRVNAIERDEK